MGGEAEEARRGRPVRGANEAAWKDMVSASQAALAEMQKGWADAVARFQ